MHLSFFLLLLLIIIIMVFLVWFLLLLLLLFSPPTNTLTLWCYVHCFVICIVYYPLGVMSMYCLLSYNKIYWKKNKNKIKSNMMYPSEGTGNSLTMTILQEIWRDALRKDAPLGGTWMWGGGSGGLASPGDRVRDRGTGWLRWTGGHWGSLRMLREG